MVKYIDRNALGLGDCHGPCPDRDCHIFCENRLWDKIHLAPWIKGAVEKRLQDINLNGFETKQPKRTL